MLVGNANRGSARVALLLGVAASGCGAATQPPSSQPEVVAAAPSRPRHTPADVRFMQGMIAHHAQALVMARWVPGRSTRTDLGILGERMIVSQEDEIDIMRQWLRDRGETVPDTGAVHNHAGMNMSGAASAMPGMVTPMQLEQLERARGSEFDRLFLTFMIQHHTGAVTMVDQLFSTYGAGQDDMIFKFASDVAADQTSEIDRMRAILSTISRMPARQ